MPAVNATFNDGWRDGSCDAQNGKAPVYIAHQRFTDTVCRVVDTGVQTVDSHLTNYARGYVGGYAAKTATPPIGAPDPEPVTLSTLVRQIEKLRTLWLLGGGDEEDVTAGLEPGAEQHYLLAIGALEQAQRFAALAAIHQARAKAKGLVP